MRLISILSGFVYLAGILIIVAISGLAWLVVIAEVASQVHALAGAAIFLATLWIGHRYDALLRWPWEFWYWLWIWADDEITRRAIGPPKEGTTK